MLIRDESLSLGMVTVEFNPGTDTYQVKRRGRVLSNHSLARRAKEEGKRVGRKHGEPVSYTPKNGGETKFIFRPSSSNQFGSSSSGSSSGGFLDDLLG